MLSDISYKIRRKCNNLRTVQLPLGHGPAGKDKISLVLYLDYEREFGHPMAIHTAQAGFERVFHILHSQGIRATWNCVGLIAEHYPETIIRLIESGQEIASHTHNHCNPLNVSTDALISDLSQTKNVFWHRFAINIKGFHAPEDGWRACLADILSGLGYEYAFDRGMNPRHAALCHDYLSGGRQKGASLLKIPSINDDWAFMEGASPREVLSSWQETLDNVPMGSASAMGFHPWVLGRDDAWLGAFAAFLYSALNRRDTVLYTGEEIASWYKGKKAPA